MKLYVFAAAALLAGCTTTSQIVPVGKDSYIVSSSSPGTMHKASVAVRAAEAANAYCEKLGKHMVIRQTADNHLGITGNETNLLFGCVSDTDPEYMHPALPARPQN